MTTVDEEALHLELDKGPDDNTRLVLADLMEEQGMTEVALFHRLMVKNKWHPVKSMFQEAMWLWVSTAAGQPHYDTARIGEELLNRIKGDGNWNRYFETRKEAEHALMVALRNLP